MACEHTRIMTVNCKVFCADCHEELPIDYLVGKDRVAAQNAEKATEKPAEKKTTRKKVK